LRLQVATEGERILGSNILGFQVGNEPDLYAQHLHRPTTYAPQDYLNEFQTVVNALSNTNSLSDKNNLIGPSITGTNWLPNDVWSTGFQSIQQLKILTVEK